MEGIPYDENGNVVEQRMSNYFERLTCIIKKEVHILVNFFFYYRGIFFFQ